MANNIRPDRQTLLFSATMERKIERLCRDILIDPIRITIGTLGAANQDIAQMVAVLHDDSQKWGWLAPKLPDFAAQGAVIVFVATKQGAEELAGAFKQHLGVESASIHGDKSQPEREEVLRCFKKGTVSVLVATDVAARGLDIKTVKTVVNYDCAKDIDSHVHRIGRTGRAGDTDGAAFTLLTQKDAVFASELVFSMQEAGQAISTELEHLAQSGAGRNRSKGGGKGGGSGFRGGGGRGHGGRGGRAGRGGRGRGGGIGFTDNESHTSRSVGGAGRSSVAANFQSRFKSAGTEGGATSFRIEAPVGAAAGGASTGSFNIGGGGTKFRSDGALQSTFLGGAPPPQLPPGPPPPGAENPRKRKSRWD